MNQSQQWSRRGVLIGGVAGAIGVMTAGGASPALADEITLKKQTDPWKGLKIGCATYTLNKLKTDEAQVRAMFEYTRDVGVPVMVCAPSVDSLPICEKMVKEFDIRMAIHNHGPEDKNFPSPYDVIKAVEKMDPRMGCCIDVGHSARAGADPAEAIEKIGPRVYDVHLKDLQRIDRRSIPIECGRGVLDIKGILAALIKIRFAGHVGFEHEKDAADVIPGLAECVGYVRGTLAGM